MHVYLIFGWSIGPPYSALSHVLSIINWWLVELNSDLWTDFSWSVIGRWLRLHLWPAPVGLLHVLVVIGVPVGGTNLGLLFLMNERSMGGACRRVRYYVFVLAGLAADGEYRQTVARASFWLVSQKYTQIFDDVNMWMILSENDTGTVWPVERTEF